MLRLPERVEVVEVGPRDGLQSLGRVIDTGRKVAMVDRLSELGFPTIEVTGFVRPEVIPALADAEQVMARIRRRPGTRYRGHAPNARGAERAVAAGCDEVLGLIVASETYLRKNQNMDTERAVAQAIRGFEIAARAGLGFVMAISAAFWDPYEGRTPEARVLDLVARFHAAGMRRLYLAGSMGMEDPRHVNALFREVARRWPELELGFHVHNMAGLATANILAALDAGARFIEGAICGLGGGIAMPGGTGAVGNLATEDILYLLNESGIETGIGTEAAVAASREIAALLGIEPASHLARCGGRAELMARGRPAPAPG